MSRFGPRRPDPPLDFRFLDFMVILLVILGGLAAVAALERRPTELAIRNTRLAPAYTGSPYVQELFATGGEAPYTWSASGLPPGLDLDAAGVLHGIAETDGRFSAELTVRGAGGRQASGRLPLEVCERYTPIPLVVVTRELQPGRVGDAFTATLAAEGGAPPYRWSVEGLPPGLVLAGATLQGSPEQPAVAKLTARVADSREESAARELSLLIQPPPLDPAVEQRSPLHVATEAPAAIEGNAYALRLSATGGDPPYQWQLLQDVDGLELTSDGLLHSPAVPEFVPGSLFVRVFDAAGRSSHGEIRFAVVRPPTRVTKVAVVAAAVAAWVLLLLYLKHWVTTRPRPVRIRSADLSSLLALAFLLLGVAVYFASLRATLVFVVGMLALGVVLYRDYT